MSIRPSILRKAGIAALSLGLAAGARIGTAAAGSAGAGPRAIPTVTGPNAGTTQGNHAFDAAAYQAVPIRAPAARPSERAAIPA